VCASGDDAERATLFATRFLDAYRIDGGADIEIHRSLPRHAGLGSGTQLALAVARSLAELYSVPATTSQLARAVGRGGRSAVGTWTFEDGGLVVEGGRNPTGDTPGPLLARLPFPRSWECVLAIPHSHQGVTGGQEEQAFTRLAEPPAAEAHEVAHLVLMSLLPAVVENDIVAFGRALTRIQEITGDWFAEAQGGVFQPLWTAHLIQAMKELGAPGVGQTSWGPAAYAVVDGHEAAVRLESHLASKLGRDGTVIRGPFPDAGAHIWRSSYQEHPSG
jgi:beta-RFAP synthase